MSSPVRLRRSSAIRRAAESLSRPFRWNRRSDCRSPARRARGCRRFRVPELLEVLPIRAVRLVPKLLAGRLDRRHTGRAREDGHEGHRSGDSSHRGSPCLAFDGHTWVAETVTRWARSETCSIKGEVGGAGLMPAGQRSRNLSNSFTHHAQGPCSRGHALSPAEGKIPTLPGNGGGGWNRRSPRRRGAAPQ